MEKQGTELLWITNLFLSNLCTCPHAADLFLNNHGFILSMFQSRPSDYSIPKERQICFHVTICSTYVKVLEKEWYHICSLHVSQNFMYLDNIFFHFLLQSRVVSEVLCEILDLHLAFFTIAFSYPQFISCRLSTGMGTPLKSSNAYSQTGTKSGPQIQQALFLEHVQILVIKSLAVQIIKPFSLYDISESIQ